MRYSRMQQSLSYLLIFSILFLQTFHIPLLDSTEAAVTQSDDLVSIFVENGVYSDVKDSIDQYARDITAYLPNTRTVIVPIAGTVNPSSIAAVNEKLYYEGDGKWVSRLAGTILVGDLPIPVVHRNSKAFLSIYPYVDFVDKNFVYDPTKGYYDYASSAVLDDQPEIWHSIIRPNTGNSNTDTTKLIEFFKKTHDFYMSKGAFAPENTLKDPYVFYFDGFHDMQSSKLSEWRAYNNYLQNIEEFAYNRFNKSLAKKMYDAYQSILSAADTPIDNPEINALLDQYKWSQTLNLDNAPDITTKKVLDKLAKQFFDILNAKYLGDILQYVHNAGRYGDGSNVRADIVPVMVAKQDLFAKSTLKDTNTAMEGVIDDIVKNGLSRDIPVFSGAVNYKNYLYGRDASTLSGATDCSIVRGSGDGMVESNRGMNIKNAQSDASLLQTDLPNGGCFPKGKIATQTYWGGNSPMNLSKDAIGNNGALELGAHSYSGFVMPIFDILGSKTLSGSTNGLTIDSPLDCLKTDVLLQPYDGADTAWIAGRVGYWPTEKGRPPAFSCVTEMKRPTDEYHDFEWYYKNPACNNTLELDGAAVGDNLGACIGGGAEELGAPPPSKWVFQFHRVPSILNHKSPTDEEYGAQLTTMFTPSLPFDRDRYVDFLGAKGNLKKIAYPNFFRITLTKNEFDASIVEAKIKTLLDSKSKEINDIIQSENPAGLIGKDLDIYNILKSGTYPSAPVDLFGTLQKTPEVLAALVQSVIWHNLDNPTIKYSYILEHHLDINGKTVFELSGHKKDYEIAYLGSPGIPEGMYVKMDPEEKAPLDPYLQSILDNLNTYKGLVNGVNLTTDSGDNTKCGPPEGVPIWQWLPAIFCWIGTVLPPTIGIGSCSGKPLFGANEDPAGYAADPQNFRDGNNQKGIPPNGIPDGAEIIGQTGSKVKLAAEQSHIYGYNDTIPLIATLLDARDYPITVDNYNRVRFSVDKIVAYSGGTSLSDRVTVYDSGSSDPKLSDSTNIGDYIRFNSALITAQNGVAKAAITARDQDVDVTVRASIFTKDKDGKVVVDKQSDPLSVQIRGDRIVVSMKTGNTEVTSVEAGSAPMLNLSLSHIDKNGNVLAHDTPYTLNVFDDVGGNVIAGPIAIQSGVFGFNNRQVLDKSGVYRFEVTDKNGIVGSNTLTVLPSRPTKIELVPASSVFVKGNTTTVLIRLLDTFGNLASGEVYQLTGNALSGAKFLSTNGSVQTETVTQNVVDGYARVDVTSSSVGKIGVKFSIANPKVESSIQDLTVVENAKIHVEVANPNNIVVGTGSHDIKISVLGADGKKIDGFSGIASIDFPKLSGTLNTSFVTIENGESSGALSLTPAFVSGHDLKLDIQIPGIDQIEGNTVNVLPDHPMSFEFQSDTSKVEAVAGNKIHIRASLYDQYGNIADNATGYSLSGSVLRNSEKYISFPDGTTAKSGTFSGGTIDFDLAATDFPGRGYLVGSVSPSLKNNSFTVIRKKQNDDGTVADDPLTVSGVSENFITLDTYYLFNHDKIAGTENNPGIKYNALYTVLQGANYGDVTRPNYLGGEILFNPGSRSLAVTSLLGARAASEELFSFTPAGKYSGSTNNTDLAGLTAEISSDNDHSFLSFYDKFAKEYVARAWFNFDPAATKFAPCTTTSKDDISDCSIPTDSSFILAKGFGTSIAKTVGNTLTLNDANGTNLLSIDTAGRIRKYPAITLVPDASLTANMFGLKVMSNSATVGYVAMKFVKTTQYSNGKIESLPSSAFPAAFANKNQILIEQISSRYSCEKSYLGNSSHGDMGIVCLRSDIGTTPTIDSTYGGRSDVTGYEAYDKQTGIGWKDDNRALLELAGGSTVGQATRMFGTFSMVNLGDPVAHLPGNKPADHNYDRTIGQQIVSGKGEQIESYKKIDFNGDGVPDLVVFYQSGKIQLLANYQGSFRDMGYLAYVANAAKDRKAVGDFFGDKYADIVLTDDTGKLVLLDNTEGKFSQSTYPTLIDENGKPTSLKGKITQLEAFDMDGDGQMDIVTVDDSGELNILYWVKAQGERLSDGRILNHGYFRKKLLDSTLGVALSPNARNDGGAFYGSNIEQLDPFGYQPDTYGSSIDLAKQTQADQQKLQALVKAGKNAEAQAFIDGFNNATGDKDKVSQTLIDSKIYYQYNYSAPKEIHTASDTKAAVLQGVGSLVVSDGNGGWVDKAGTVAYPVAASASGSSSQGAGVTAGVTDTINFHNDTKNEPLADDIIQGMAEVAKRGTPDTVDFQNIRYQDSDSSSKQSVVTFIRSQFADAKGVKVEKVYADTNGGQLQADDPIKVTLKITNNTSATINGGVYLDSNDTKIFRASAHDAQYTIHHSTDVGTGTTQNLVTTNGGDFDYVFSLGTLPANDTIEITYSLSANAISYGKVVVGALDASDPDGDVAMNPNNSCGGDMIIWRSTAKRQYSRGTKKFQDTSELPKELKDQSADQDGNGVPDTIDALTNAAKQGDTSLLQQYSQQTLAKQNVDGNNNGIPDKYDTKGNPVVSYNASTRTLDVGGFSAGNIDAINGQIDDVVKGLGCGFGWGACISMPLNWAPLAPGSVPTVLGYPMGMLTPSTGLPILSGMTGFPLYGPWGCIPIPVIWPMSPIGLESTCTANIPSAGGYMGTWSLANQFRLYITPTITGAVGEAACFGGPAILAGNIPPPVVSPIVPGGNCIVAAQPFLGCKGDGDDGDVTSVGIPNNNYINANSCIPQNTTVAPLSASTQSSLTQYIKTRDTSVLPEVSASIAKGGGLNLSAGPLIGIGLGSGEQPNFEININSDALKNFDLGNIIEIKNKRVSAFPDFIMEWVTRQMEEVINKLTTLPTLYIVLPDFSGIMNSGWNGFVGKLDEAYNKAKTGAQSTDFSSNFLVDPKIDNDKIKEIQGKYNDSVASQKDTINAIGQNVSGVKAAYEFMSHLPLIKLENNTVDVSVPMISQEDAKKWIANNKKIVEQWEKEIDSKKTEWGDCGNDAKKCADQKILIDASSTLSTMKENIHIIEDYAKFPEKLQKYLTWKERYAGQILCNIQAIEVVMGGWISDNGKRFRAWVELYVLIKAILKSWQLIIDLFNSFQSECSVCRNERYDLKHFIFKIISAVIPKIPIIQFPKWPDIWLDLHNIRAGLRIAMPEFHMVFVPIVLPQLPRLYLPNVPGLGINLPSIPLLPRLPPLPDLPDLPSLPLIKLPDLPPPPTIPKLFGGIAAVLQILKLIAKVLCIMRINPFVPEWRAGDQIAQITERQGKFSLDFLNIELPNVSLSFIDAIKVASYVNLEFDTNFILEMARQTTDPLNTFTNNTSNILNVRVPNVDLKNVIPQGTIPVNIGNKPQGMVTPKSSDKSQALFDAALQKVVYGTIGGFIQFVAYLRDHRDDTAPVAVLRDILRDNITTLQSLNDPRVAPVIDTLNRAVSYDGSADQDLIDSLSRANRDKFAIVREYVEAEKRDTLKLKTQIDDIIRSGSNDSLVPSLGGNLGAVKIAALNDVTTARTAEYNTRLDAVNKSILPSLNAIRSGTPDPAVAEIRATGEQIKKTVNGGLQAYVKDLDHNENLYSTDYSKFDAKVLADNTTTTSSSPLSTSTTSTGKMPYTYQYEGIYIIDNGKQIRLFDYTDPVDGTEELLYGDFGGNGGRDIVYRMNNSLYLKKDLSVTPRSHSATDPRTIDWRDFLGLGAPDAGDGSGNPRMAPNYFHESFSNSNEIDFSFQPADPTNDSQFRLEYYDYIDRFDNVAAADRGKTSESGYPVKPPSTLHVVDLIPDLSLETVDTSTLSQTGVIGRKNIANISDANGQQIVRMNTFETKDTSSPAFIMTQGKKMYTGTDGAKVSYSLGNQLTVLDIGKNMNYEFLSDAQNVRVLRGAIYLFSVNAKEQSYDLRSLIGIPLPEKTKIQITDPNGKWDDFIRIRYYDGSQYTLRGNSTYEYYWLGTRQKNYNVAVSERNDWYYARLYSFGKNGDGTIASLDLLAPQKAADTEGPTIDYGDTIRIPVYQTQTIDMGPYIHDISGVASAWIDADLGVDSDGDKNTSNDKDSNNPNSTFHIKGDGAYKFTFGPFDSLFTKTIRLFASDTAGNTSQKDIRLTVYSPIPDITSVSGSIVSGKLNESLQGEPIDLFRYRNGGLVRLQTDETKSKTASGGTFDIPTRTGSGLVLKKWADIIATVDESTARINIDSKYTNIYTVTVESANATTPMQIVVRETASEKNIFSEALNLSQLSKVEQVVDFATTKTEGVYFVPANNQYRLVPTVPNAPFIPGGAYLTDNNYKAILGISKEGGIGLMNTAYRLGYDQKDGYVVVRVSDASGTNIGSFFYRIKSEYVIK